jgi:hypothetical protein
MADGNEVVARICDHLRSEGVNPDTATVLSFVTWEEIVRMVVTSAGDAGVFPIEWPGPKEIN